MKLSISIIEKMMQYLFMSKQVFQIKPAGQKVACVVTLLLRRSIERGKGRPLPFPLFVLLRKSKVTQHFGNPARGERKQGKQKTMQGLGVSLSCF